MKRLGLIGGSSWHSTIEYYRHINQRVNDIHGNNTNPPISIFNLNQQKTFELQGLGRWDSIADNLVAAANSLIAGGAEAVMFCANTPHKVYYDVQNRIPVPILHIADKTGQEIKRKGLLKVGIIGTIFTMEGNFIHKRLQNNYDIQVITPEKESRVRLHQIIQSELTMGQFLDSTKEYILSEIDKMRERGAEGIILGCTEFPLIISQSDLDIPTFDTTILHAEYAVDYIMGDIKM
jgi:aspartate racemase